MVPGGYLDNVELVSGVSACLRGPVSNMSACLDGPMSSLPPSRSVDSRGLNFSRQ